MAKKIVKSKEVIKPVESVKQKEEKGPVSAGATRMESGSMNPVPKFGQKEIPERYAGGVEKKPILK